MQKTEAAQENAPEGSHAVDDGSSRQAIATTVNALLISIVVGGTLFQLFIMPFLLRAFGTRAAVLLAPVILLQPLHWGLIHEAIHSHLLPKRRAAEFWARLLSILLWLPFDATRFCHLVHHRFSRHAYDRSDVYDGQGSYALAWLRYRARLFGGIYFGFVVTPLIAFIPLSRGVRLMIDAVPIREDGDTAVCRLFVSLAMNMPKRRRTRREFTIALALYGASLWLYGEWWPVLVAAMWGRGIWYSFADNVAHHDVALDEPHRARDYRLPRLFGRLLMNQHLHLTHHRYPNSPWGSLDRLCEIGSETRNSNYFSAAFRQLARVYPRVAI